MSSPNLTQVPVDHVGAGHPDRAYVDRAGGWVVQVWEDAAPACRGTPWAGVLRVAIKHTAAKTRDEFHGRQNSLPITWDDIQAIKDQFWPGRVAVEVFPPHRDIVNVADMRWIWVLPPGAVLPFSLQAKADVLVSA